MGKKTCSTKVKDFPLKIKSIYDKKVEKDGTTSYLVQYKDEDVEAWASKNYLCKDLDNKKTIQKYEILIQIQSNSQQKQIKSEKSIKNDHNEIAKRKSIKKTSQPNKKKNQKIKQIKTQNNDAKNQNKVQALNFVQERKGEIEANHQKVEVRQKQIIKNSECLNDLQEIKIYSKVQPNSEKNFKIIKAKIDIDNRIQFQVKYQNGLLVWLDGDIVKTNNPLEVIRFYEKRISWGC